MSSAEFDEFARKYEKTMERACAVSGESPDFCAVERMQWCRRRLHHWLPADTALDFGCGTGGSTRYFFDTLGCQKVIAVDPSVEKPPGREREALGLECTAGNPGRVHPRG
jgi:ubiquinone/menaquinone biosynthesis C-methylase UbiE